MCAIPPFAEPFISGPDADLEPAPVMNAEDLEEGLVPARLTPIRVTAA
jgi:hypothetical protein